MNFDERIKKILDKKSVKYNDDDIKYLKVKIPDYGQTDKELYSEIVKVTFDKIKNDFSDQVDYYDNDYDDVNEDTLNSSDQIYEELAKIFESDYKPNPISDLNNLTFEEEDEEVKNFFNTYFNDPDGPKRSYENFVNSSVYQDDEDAKRMVEIKEKSLLFINHTIGFAFFSAIGAAVQTFRIGGNEQMQFLKMFLESYFLFNSFYGFAKLVKFVRKISKLDDDGNIRRK